jgi:hypothetical protein
MTEDPKTPVEAVTLGLYLAITAPTAEKAMAATAIAASIAKSANLSDHEMDTAKALALATVELEMARRK